MTEAPKNRPLSLRHKLVADQYLLHGNISEAARQARYAPKNAPIQGREVLQRPEVAAYVSARRLELVEMHGLSRADVARDLRALAHSNLDDFTVDDDGVLALADGAPKDAMRAVARFKRRVRTRTVTATDGTETVEKVVDVEMGLWSKPEALKQAAEILEMAGSRAPTVAERLSAGLALETPGPGSAPGTPTRVVLQVNIVRE